MCHDISIHYIIFIHFLLPKQGIHSIQTVRFWIKYVKPKILSLQLVPLHLSKSLSINIWTLRDIRRLRQLWMVPLWKMKHHMDIGRYTFSINSFPKNLLNFLTFVHFSFYYRSLQRMYICTYHGTYFIICIQKVRRRMPIFFGLVWIKICFIEILYQSFYKMAKKWMK